MKNGNAVLKIVPAAAAVIAAVVVLSAASAALWGGKAETPPPDRQIVIRPGMTGGEFAADNALPPEAAKKVLNLASEADLGKKISDLPLPAEEIVARAKKAFALEHEDAGKDWMKIAAKFVLWTVFLAVVYVFLKKRKLDPGRRRMFLGLGVFIFGVVLGADPSPMGTVKDAVVPFGKSGAIFPPRLAAFILMIAGGKIGRASCRERV